MVGLATAGLALFLVGEGLALIAPGSELDTTASVVHALAFGNVQTAIGLGTGGSALLNSLAAVASVVAGVFLITIIQRITRRQRDRYAKLLRGA